LSPPFSFLQPVGRGLDASFSNRGTIRAVNCPDNFFEFFFRARS
jgi:hypothetical protein